MTEVPPIRSRASRTSPRILGRGAYPTNLLPPAETWMGKGDRKTILDVGINDIGYL